MFFGDILESLLANFGEAVDKSEIGNQDSYILNKVGSKGKFDVYERSLTSSPSYAIKIFFYLASWVCRIIGKVLTVASKRKNRITKTVFYFVYFHHKIHFGIFNSFIASGVLLTTRTLLHTKVIPTDFFTLFDKFISVLCFLLVLADFHILFATAIDFKNDWGTNDVIVMEERHEKERKKLLDFLEANAPSISQNPDMSGMDDSVSGLNPATPLKELKVQPYMVPLHWLTPK